MSLIISLTSGFLHATTSRASDVDDVAKNSVLASLLLILERIAVCADLLLLVLRKSEACCESVDLAVTRSKWYTLSAEECTLSWKKQYLT